MVCAEGLLYLTCPPRLNLNTELDKVYQDEDLLQFAT